MLDLTEMEATQYYKEFTPYIKQKVYENEFKFTKLKGLVDWEIVFSIAFSKFCNTYIHGEVKPFTYFTKCCFNEVRSVLSKYNSKKYKNDIASIDELSDEGVFIEDSSIHFDSVGFWTECDKRVDKCNGRVKAIYTVIKENEIYLMTDCRKDMDMKRRLVKIMKDQSDASYETSIRKPLVELQKIVKDVKKLF